MATATFVKQHNGNGDGRVYRCDPPMPAHDWFGGDADHNVEECSGAAPCESTEYVWVSAANVVYSGPETYIFACDEDGEVTDWSELPGSLRGDLNHEAALTGAGYEIKEN